MGERCETASKHARRSDNIQYERKKTMRWMKIDTGRLMTDILTLYYRTFKFKLGWDAIRKIIALLKPIIKGAG